MLENKQKVVLYGIYIVLFVVSVYIGIKIGDKHINEKQEKINILCIGVDKEVPMTERDPNTNSIGQADALYLISIDRANNNEISIVAVPRDTIVNIKKYNSRMEYLGSGIGQICTQYAYADGTVRSCELTQEKIEDIFPGVEIDAYIAININAIVSVNDAIGGVEVYIHDEYTAYQMSVWNNTTVNLTGRNAMLFLRARNLNESESAYGRIDKIKEYIQAFIPKAIKTILKDPMVLKDIYEALEQNMVTNIEKSDILSLIGILPDISAENVHHYTLEGEIIRGSTGYEEFYPYEEQLQEIIKILQ